jgi:muramoyltetrapeptide carboxypeptidase
MSKINRREFIGSVTAMGTLAAFAGDSLARSDGEKKLIKPGRIIPGETFGLVAPASGPFEPGDIEEGKAVLEALGFRVKTGRNIRKKWNYLAGTEAERAADLHEMFADPGVKGIISIRGGYGSGRLLNYLDYDLIQQHPKILVGYSDISLLNLAIHRLTGLVTFHGPVALSTFNEYSTKYFLKALTQAEPVGEIAEAPRSIFQKSSGLVAIREGRASGALIGGNLTMVQATLGTPFEIDTDGKILFLEEVGEEPYDLDRMLTHLRMAGKFEKIAGIVIDKCAKCGPSEFKPAFENTFSIEEIIFDRLSDLNCPVLYGMSLGHVAHKPTLPLGIQATLDTHKRCLSIDEAAVV